MTFDEYYEKNKERIHGVYKVNRRMLKEIWEDIQFVYDEVEIDIPRIPEDKDVKPIGLKETKGV